MCWTQNIGTPIIYEILGVRSLKTKIQRLTYQNGLEHSIINTKYSIYEFKWDVRNLTF